MPTIFQTYIFVIWQLRGKTGGDTLENGGHSAAGKRLVVTIPVVMCLTVALGCDLSNQRSSPSISKRRNVVVFLPWKPRSSWRLFHNTPTFRASAFQDIVILNIDFIVIN